VNGRPCAWPARDASAGSNPAIGETRERRLIEVAIERGGGRRRTGVSRREGRCGGGPRPGRPQARARTFLGATDAGGPGRGRRRGAGELSARLAACRQLATRRRQVRRLAAQGDAEPLLRPTAAATR